MGFLKSSARSQKQGSVFFTEILRVRRRQVENKKKDYVWEEYKWYPSGLVIGMCPKAYLLKQQTFNGIEDLDAIYRVRRGSAVHWEFQQDILESPRLYPKPQKRLSPRMEAKLQDNWPEVPFHELDVSGSADCVIDWQGPCPVEIKSTSKDPKKWEEEKTKLPSLQHLTQVGIYRWMFNYAGYYPEPCEKAVLAYQNLLFDVIDPKGRVEYIIDKDYRPHGYAETLDELVEELILKGLVPTMDSYRQSGEDGVLCHYPRCRACGRKN